MLFRCGECSFLRIQLKSGHSGAPVTVMLAKQYLGAKARQAQGGARPAKPAPQKIALPARRLFNMLRPMRILISGVCGFVGSTLARAFTDSGGGYDLVGFDNFIRPGSET